MAKGDKSVDEFIKSLPEDRQSAISTVRRTILSHLPKGYVECLQGRMIGYVVPHSLYPAGYHCDPRQPLPYAALTVPKSHIALHLMSVYGDAATDQWFRKAYKATGKKLDMGKACLRFKKLDDLPLDVIGQLIARTTVKAYIARIEKFFRERSSKRPE
jgi:hypothetical protein